MPTPYEAPVLRRLRNALDRRWPNRDRRSDGWIGDPAHQARTSDHNPDPRTGVVRARDVDHDGVHRPTVLAALILHPSTRYVIYNREEYNHKNGFKPVPYNGSNPHTSHFHESIKSGTAETRADPWTLIEGSPSWSSGIRRGDKGSKVREVQAYLIAYNASIRLDGDFGPATDSALRSFQRGRGLVVDGIAGPKTLARMRTA